MSDSSRTRPLEFHQLPEQDMIDRAGEFYQQMRTRRTVRDFADRSIPMQVIEHAIATAGTAPSGANKQPWHFAVTADPQVKAQLRHAAEREAREEEQTRNLTRQQIIKQRLQVRQVWLFRARIKTLKKISSS